MRGKDERTGETRRDLFWVWMGAQGSLLFLEEPSVQLLFLCKSMGLETSSLPFSSWKGDPNSPGELRGVTLGWDTEHKGEDTEGAA